MKLVTLFIPGLLSSLISVVISDAGKNEKVRSYVPEGPPEYPSEVSESSERNNISPSTKLTDSVLDESSQQQENTREDGNEILREDGSRSTAKLRSPRSVMKSSRGDKTSRKQRVKELRMNVLKQIKDRKEGKRKQRSSHKSIKSKLEEEDDTDDYDAYDYYDYQDPDDSVYGFAHFQVALDEYFDTVLQVNDSMQEELSDMKWKLSRMEKLLNENIARTKALEALSGGAMRPNISPNPNPVLGDLRLKVSNSDDFLLREGYLQIYSGTCWGFVCDDFFDQVAAKVACVQMGETGENATVDTPSTTDATTDNTWRDDFPIVLDDVSCTGNEDTLLSCDHAAIAEHDCSKDEIVFISC